MASSTFVVLLAIFIQHPQPELSGELPALAGQAVGASFPTGSPLDGVNIAITGPTSGIGIGLARYLHGLGATIIAIGRSPSKLQALQAALDGDADNRNNKRRVETFVADLTDLSSVARAADEIASRFDSISYLINNAGLHYTNDLILGFRRKHATQQGYDGTLYFDHLLLPTIYCFLFYLIHISYIHHIYLNLLSVLSHGNSGVWSELSQPLPTN